MDSPANKPHIYEFGPFRLHVEGRTLWKAGRVVQLTPKVFDTLLFLIENRGRLVRKEELIEALWPDSFVEERNLTQNIFLLRKALGDDERSRRYIQTAPKVGYRFIADVRMLPHSQGAAGSSAGENLSEPTAPADVTTDSALAAGDSSVTQKAGDSGLFKGLRARLRMTKSSAVVAGIVLVALCGVVALLYGRLRDDTGGRALPTAGGRSGRAGSPPQNIESKRYFETGLYLWSRRTPDGIKKSVAYFQKAIEHEPGNALAYASLADSYYLIHFYGLDGFADGEAYRKSLEAATAALERDPALAEAHSAMGMILRLNAPTAETYFRKSIELNPSLATTRHRYGQFLIRNGRLDEGLAEIRRAHELAPTSPAINRALAYTLFLSRQYDEVIKLCRVWLDVDANDAAARLQLIMSYIQRGMRAEAEAELRRIGDAETVRREAIKTAAYLNARSGEHSEARRLARAFETETRGWPYYSAYNLGVIYASMGKGEEALRYLGRAGDLVAGGPEHQKEDFLNGLLFDPQFDPLREDSRFKAFLRRHGL